MKPDQEQFSAEGFVLAGGRSTRMGQDKALLSVDGRSLLDHALDKLRALPLAGAPRIAAARSDLSAHAPVIADRRPGCGPLSGIEAALAASARPLNVFLPVDLPLLPPQFLLWMLQRAALTGALVTVPRINGLPQPLCAVYHRDLLDHLGAAHAHRRTQSYACGHRRRARTIPRPQHRHLRCGTGGFDLCANVHLFPVAAVPVVP